MSRYDDFFDLDRPARIAKRLAALRHLSDARRFLAHSPGDLIKAEQQVDALDLDVSYSRNLDTFAAPIDAALAKRRAARRRAERTGA